MLTRQAMLRPTRQMHFITATKSTWGQLTSKTINMVDRFGPQPMAATCTSRSMCVWPLHRSMGRWATVTYAGMRYIYTAVPIVHTGTHTAR